MSLYLVEADLRALEVELRKGEPFKIVRDASEGDRLTRTVGTLDQQKGMVFLVRDADVPSIRLRPIPNGNLHRISSFSEPVIEFLVPAILEGELRPGRIYAETRTDDGDQRVEKNSDFVKWVPWVFSRCRRVLKKDRTTGGLCGEEALRLRDSGRLTFGKL